MLVNHVEKVKNDIKIFNDDSNESIELIRKKFKTRNQEEIQWNITKLFYLNDKKYLPVVRDFYNSLDENQRSLKYKLLNLRKRMGDDQFSKADQIFLVNREQATTEKRKRTVELFQKEQIRGRDF